MIAALALGGYGRALADPPAWAHHGVYNFEDGGQAQDRGSVAGTIASVDYSSGEFTLDTAKGRITVQVTPSTSIFRGKSGYAALTDLRQGARVQVFVSQVDGRLIAQIIRIR
ncbi:MAG TPA: DUF5666 domain-containing protein [Candidatus Baltobacteraceae bacterium]|jgi:Cu/Ag efflux protein CusF